jgi:hypothetical protein
MCLFGFRLPGNRLIVHFAAYLVPDYLPYSTVLPYYPVFRIRIRIRIRMFLGLPDPDTDPAPDPSLFYKSVEWTEIMVAKIKFYYRNFLAKNLI